ncbi:hypothetical protein VNO80_16499 [Phaseolus coccineus]|uniref:Uncharacterized protein n=1 Tax=Phaseolus coccineus TaxID=3886 RepID=A0AAN9R074_PHACN
MQTPLDPSFLVNLLLVAFVLVALILFIYNLTRTRGIHDSFINEDEGQQIAAEAEIKAEGISNSFKNAKKGKQILGKAKIICDSSKAANPEQNIFLKILDLLIAYFFRGQRHRAHHEDKKK